MASITQIRNANGTIRWKARVVLPSGKRATHTAATWELAKEWADDVESQPGMDNSFMQDYTAAQLIEQYEDTVRDDKRACDEFLASKAAPLTLDKITPTLLKRVFAKQIKARPRQIPECLAVFSDAWEQFKTIYPGAPLPQNPVSVLNLTKIAPRDRRVYPDEEMRIRESFRDARNDYLDAVLTVALDTGLLQHEIVTICWHDIDSSNDKLLINGKVIPLSGRVKAALNFMRAANGNSEYVFGDLTTVALHRAFKRRLEKLNINDLTFNDLRNEAIYRFKESGMTKEHARKVLGYKTDDNLTRIFDEQE